MNEIVARQIPLLNPSENEHMPLLPELGGPFGRTAINMVLLTELFAWQPPTVLCKSCV